MDKNQKPDTSANIQRKVMLPAPCLTRMGRRVYWNNYKQFCDQYNFSKFLPFVNVTEYLGAVTTFSGIYSMNLKFEEVIQ